MKRVNDILDQPVIDFVTIENGSRGTLADIETAKEIELSARQNLERAENRLVAMRRLHEITKDIVSHLQIEDVVDSILLTATQGLGAYAADVLLRDFNTGQWTIYAEYNKPFDYTGVSLSLDEYGPEIEGVLEGKTVIMNDFGKWLESRPGFLSSFSTKKETEFWLSSISMSAPLWRDGDVIGLVAVTEINTTRVFNQDDADFLSLFAGIASIAFVNADVHSKLRELNLSLESRVEQRTKELQVANEELKQKTIQLDKALGATIRLQEAERERIANELHDTSCQMVAGALFEIQAAQKSLSDGNAEITASKHAAAIHIIRDLDKANRDVMEATYPSLLSNRGLVFALEYSIGSVKAQLGGNCELLIEGDPVRLSKQEELALFRIVVEAVTNALKHAKAAKTIVRVVFHEGLLTISIIDNGIGFDNSARIMRTEPHRGLIGIQDRAASINAHFSINTLPGGGTTIQVKLPITVQ